MNATVDSGMSFDEGTQRGLFIYSPIYRAGMPKDTLEDRRAAMTGLIYIAIRLDDFVHGAMDELPADIPFDIYDGDRCTADRQLFDSLQGQSRSLPAGYRPTFTSTRQVEVIGRKLTLSFKTLPIFDTELAHTESSVLWAGSVVGVLLFFNAHVLVTSRAERAALRDRMNAARRFATMANSASAMIWMVDAEGRFIEALNPQQRKRAGTARNSAEALLDALNDILDFSKREAHT